METVSLREGMRLELEGAAQRFAVARLAVEDFESQHAGNVVSAELAESLARQRDFVLTELDSARRRYEECQRQFQQMRGDA